MTRGLTPAARIAGRSRPGVSRPPAQAGPVRIDRIAGVRQPFPGLPAFPVRAPAGG